MFTLGTISFNTQEGLLNMTLLVENTVIISFKAGCNDAPRVDELANQKIKTVHIL